MAFVLDFILRKQTEINLLLESNHFFILFCGCVGNTLQVSFGKKQNKKNTGDEDEKTEVSRTN